MASKSYDPIVLDRDEAGDGLSSEGDFSFASPALGEILPHPGGHFVLLGSQRASYPDSPFVQPPDGSAGIREVIEFHEHVHESGYYRINGCYLTGLLALMRAPRCSRRRGFSGQATSDREARTFALWKCRDGFIPIPALAEGSSREPNTCLPCVLRDGFYIWIEAPQLKSLAALSLIVPLSPHFLQHVQPLLGVGDKLFQARFRTRVLGKS